MLALLNPQWCFSREAIAHRKVAHTPALGRTMVYQANKAMQTAVFMLCASSNSRNIITNNVHLINRLIQHYMQASPPAAIWSILRVSYLSLMPTQESAGQMYFLKALPSSVTLPVPGLSPSLTLIRWPGQALNRQNSFLCLVPHPDSALCSTHSFM